MFALHNNKEKERKAAQKSCTITCRRHLVAQWWVYCKSNARRDWRGLPSDSLYSIRIPLSV